MVKRLIMAASQGKDVRRFISAKLSEYYPTSATKKKAPGEFSLEKIADDLGVSKPQISSALKGPRGIGPKFEQQFAKRYFRGSIDLLRAAAAKWAESHPAGAEDVDEAAGMIEQAGELLAKSHADTTPEAVLRLRAAVEDVLEQVKRMPAPTRPRRRPRSTA